MLPVQSKLGTSACSGVIFPVLKLVRECFEMFYVLKPLIALCLSKVCLSYYFRFTIEALVSANASLTQISIQIVPESSSEFRFSVNKTLETV
jgi:hypothetical protein